jgi:hypothetical protein
MSPGPSYCPYSPEFVEEEFSEVHGSNLRRLVSNQAAIVSG